tara:strand:+ start:4904 stop:7042 length:2139 start_codon:yes stop_codon:yes gene_type:complete
MTNTLHAAVVVLAATLAAPIAIAQSPAQASIDVSVQTATSPPSLTFSWPLDATATAYFVRRRNSGTPVWGGYFSIPGAGTATGYTDNTVVVGERYDYHFVKNGSTSARTFVTAGIEADAIEQRGTILLLVDDTQAAPLSPRIDRLVSDLIGDGWFVVRNDVARTDTTTNVKALIQAQALTYPDLESVFVLGHVPVPYSGQISPDGHTNHVGAWSADVYYGELDGAWTDISVNNTSASRAANHNVPGDGKFDQSVIPTSVELAVGRVDLANMPLFAATETELLEQYLDKDHDYRHKVFTVDQLAIVDDNFGWFNGEAFAASGWRNFSALVGANAVSSADYFTTLNTAAGGGYVWSYGCGGGSYTSAGGIGNTTNFTTSTNRSVFTMLFGSYFGDWDSTNNFLRAPLCSGWTLTNAWAGRPHWRFHVMGMGATIGEATRDSQNDPSAGGFFNRYVHMSLMGDPTLRQHIVAPASSLTVAPNGTATDLSWTASPATGADYHVYRAVSAAGPFSRLTANAIVGTTFTDAAPLTGFGTYMVRASKLESTPTGSYWNLSQGVFATICLPQVTAGHTSYGVGCYSPPLLLSASPAPISTPTSGTTVTYTIGDIPEAAPLSGVYFGIVIVSLSQDLAGSSLASLGMPGCDLYVGSMDLPIAYTSATDTAMTNFDVPSNVPCGTEFFATAVALVQPGSLPNGQNAFGATTSNGIASTIAPN